MLTEAYIRQLAEEALTRDDLYIVEVTISKANQILVFVESDKVLDITDCVEVSKYIESKLDRETEDFELLVSSPGLSNSMKVPRQYQKNIGRSLEVFLEGSTKKMIGTLLSADDSGIEFEVLEKQIVEGKKRKQEVLTKYTFAYSEIKTAKVEISFK